jgi:hypothetical protein
MAFDKTRKLDVTSRLDPNQARKWLSEVLHSGGVKFVRFSSHCKEEMQNDSLIPGDIYNALRGGLIYDYPEFERGTYRYRVEAQKIVVVIIFEEPNIVRCITTWRKS